MEHVQSVRTTGFLVAHVLLVQLQISKNVHGQTFLPKDQTVTHVQACSEKVWPMDSPEHPALSPTL